MKRNLHEIYDDSQHWQVLYHLKLQVLLEQGYLSMVEIRLRLCLFLLKNNEIQLLCVVLDMLGARRR
uniref:Uncharacterized protein n=1 Tax=Arundo donax TaxID=35708 RepID=A0A0A9CQI2_ARUDO